MEPETVSATAHRKDRKISFGGPPQHGPVGFEHRAMARTLGPLAVWLPLESARAMGTVAPQGHPASRRNAGHNHVQQCRGHSDVRKSPRLLELWIVRERQLHPAICGSPHVHRAVGGGSGVWRLWRGVRSGGGGVRQATGIFAPISGVLVVSPPPAGKGRQQAAGTTSLDERPPVDQSASPCTMAIASRSKPPATPS